MTKWYDMGLSRPLTLGMAHPLADRLETLAISQWHKTWARSATASLVLGVAALSAPLSIAENLPETSLADTVVTSNSGKTVIKMNKTDNNGEKINKHYEIELKGDEFEAYEFDDSGKKSKVKMSDIEGFDAEKAKNSNTWSFSIGEDNELKFDAGEGHAQEAGTRLYFKNDAENSHQLKVFENGKLQHLDQLESLKGLEKLADLKVLKNLEGLEALEDLQDLEGLEGLDEVDRLKILKNLEGIKTLKRFELGDDGDREVFIWTEDMPEPPRPPEVQNEDGDVVIHRRYAFSDNNDFDHNPVIRFKSGEREGYFMFEGDETRVESQLAAARSMLESVEDMLKDVKESEENDDTKDDLKKVRRELEQARKNLKEAEGRLREEKDAE